MDRVLKRAAPHLCPYYRRWPYTGEIWLTEVDLRGAWSRELNFFYARLPKVANSTILGSLVDGARARGIGKDLKPKQFFARPSAARAADVERIAKEAFKFAFVRDPFARTLSAYLDKVVKTRAAARRARRWFARNGIAAPDFAAFCRYLDDGGLHDDPHWAPQTQVLPMPLDALDFLGRMERLDEDIAVVHNRIFGESPASLQRRGPKPTGSSNRLAEHYTEDALAIVRRLYAADFEKLGYPLQLPR
ncbi:Sulfotransferase family protein [Poseidonocella sedimentorum]|uniref:Sulfotransferase family protein n=2 Tax=Poseidonocella sedimentorum TaxID=871652 RepID=A0A1I6D395_9RHOB|nr:Sulfotransferase family protein [Poseidonocella sedimentorum]